ncbi:hypothetical protein EDD16DRAFT_438654 [Pisolithus croceorrhizus]|nr:hypothetical protein EDD16DRAFT_438654 [Pisolithus croceorrhizus]
MVVVSNGSDLQTRSDFWQKKAMSMVLPNGGLLLAVGKSQLNKENIKNSTSVRGDMDYSLAQGFMFPKCVIPAVAGINKDMTCCRARAHHISHVRSKGGGTNVDTGCIFAEGLEIHQASIPLGGHGIRPDFLFSISLVEHRNNNSSAAANIEQGLIIIGRSRESRPQKGNAEPTRCHTMEERRTRWKDTYIDCEQQDYNHEVCEIVNMKTRTSNTGGQQ